jgi:hypothetical protein
MSQLLDDHHLDQYTENVKKTLMPDIIYSNLDSVIFPVKLVSQHFSPNSKFQCTIDIQDPEIRYQMAQEAVNVENMTVNFITTRHYSGISRCHAQTKNVNVEDFLSGFGVPITETVV